MQRFPVHLLSLYMHSLPRHPIPHQSGPSTTTDKPTLTHHHHPDSTVYFRVPSGCRTFCGSDKCVMTSVHHYGDSRNSFTALRTCCRFLTPLQPLLITDFFTVSVVLFFFSPVCHVVGIIIVCKLLILASFTLQYACKFPPCIFMV